MTSFKLLENVMVKMRDGVHLAIDIYLPTHLNQSAFPVVIERTPYNKSAHSRSEIELDGRKISRQEMTEAFTQRGFALIFQDCRGRYLSEGEFIKYVREGEDGFDTYQWILQQPWCNGSIGSMGLSYAAHTQLAAACLNPEGLKTMVLDSGGFANSYQCGIRQGGAFELKQATWAFKQTALSPTAKNNPLIANAMSQEDIHQWFTQMPWKAGHSPIRHVPEYEDYLLEQWQAGTFNEYWQQLGIYAEGWYKTLPDIPVLFMSSWYDAYVPSTLANFQAFCASDRTAPQKLIMGSWLHGDRNITHSGDVEFGSSSAFDGNVDTNWLACRLKWYLQKDMRLRQSLSEPAIHRFQSDPNNPVPTIGGAITSGKPVFVGGAFDQRELPEFFGSKQNNLPLSARHDVLVYQTEILEEYITLVGEVTIKLFIDSDAPDADFTAKLIDVYPPNEDYPQGYAMNITDGILRARYRDSWTESKLLKQGEIVEVTIRPFESCNIFKKGHCLRLDIAGSNFPHFDCNPNSGEPEGFASIKHIATNQIHIGEQYPSVLEMQVIPNK